MIKSFRVEHTSKTMPDVNVSIDKEQKYGVLCLEIDSTEIKHEEPILFHIMLDVSGSMSDIVSYNRSKMQLLKHTITNMIHYFAENCNNIYIDIKGFDDRIHNYIESTLVTKTNVDDLLHKLHNMRPMNSTNIELALDTLKSNIESGDQTMRHVSILLTDGHPTCGSMDPKDLVENVMKNKDYHFIAIGNDHNAKLMNKLGNVDPKTNNWFINEIEHTGNVYGEIIFNETNMLYENNEIILRNATIYDYRKGQFVSSLAIGNLAKELNKEYHVLINGINDYEINLQGLDVNKKKSYKITAANCFPQTLQNEDLCSKESLKELLDLDDSNTLFVTKHYLRLCVQKVLFSIRNDLENNDSIQEEGYSLLFRIPKIKRDANKQRKELYKVVHQIKKAIQQFAESNNLGKDEFIIGLLNDLNVAINSQHMEDQYTHISAREDTQGKQTAFNTASQLEVDSDNFDNLQRPVLSRDVSAYTTPSRTKIMREMSASYDDDEIFDNDKFPLPPSKYNSRIEDLEENLFDQIQRTSPRRGNRKRSPAIEEDIEFSDASP